MDPLKPPASVLVKLGSALVHAEEFLSPGGHAFDKAALEAIFNDPEVAQWRTLMDKAGLLPVKR